MVFFYTKTPFLLMFTISIILFDPDSMTRSLRDRAFHRNLRFQNATTLLISLLQDDAIFQRQLVVFEIDFLEIRLTPQILMGGIDWIPMKMGVGRFRCAVSMEFQHARIWIIIRITTVRDVLATK